MFNASKKIYPLITCILFVMCLLLAGCDQQEKVVSKQAILSELDVWVHTGNKAALLLRQDQVARFNARHSRIKVTLVSIPKGTYDAQVDAAIRTGTLPDIIELDGPSIPSFASRGALMKLDKILTTTTREDILPAVLEQGMYQGRIYSVAETSHVSVLYARKSLLDVTRYRIPTDSSDAWGLPEFEALLNSALKHDDYAAAIDIGLNNLEQSFAKTIYPMLLSAGGGLVDEHSPYQADGVLNSARNIDFLKRIQGWIDKGYVDKNSDHKAFINGRVAFSWAGLDKYSAYKNKFGDDLVVVPLPDFGFGSQYVQHAWGWGLTRNCVDTQASMRFLEFLFQPEEVYLAAQASGGVPGTYSGITDFDAFDGMPSITPLIDAHKSGRVVSQLKSPFYPVTSDAFQRAFVRIKNDALIEPALMDAVTLIDQQRKKSEVE